MAKIYFTPNANAVAQESRATPGGTVTIGDVNNLLTNGIVIATFTATVGTVANVTAGLTAAWNASTHAYKTNITASDQTTYVKLLGPAGMPWTVTSSITGVGTLTMSTPTAGTGQNSYDNPSNWSGLAVPVNSDEVTISGTSVSILWGLAQTAVTLTKLTIDQSFTGKIGLNWVRVATLGDGSTDGAAEEYRDAYLAIKVNGTVEIGKPKGFGAAVGSGRINLDLSTQATTVIVHNTAATETELGRNCVRLLANSATTDIIVRSAPGGVGIGTERADETATVRSVIVGDPSATGFTSLPSGLKIIDGQRFVYSPSGLATTQSRVVVGAGTTLTNFVQEGGDNVLSAAATVASVIAKAGFLTTEGDFTVTSLVNGEATPEGVHTGAQLTVNHIKTGGNCVTTAILIGGFTDASRVGRAQAWGTVTAANSGVFKYNPDYTTITAAGTMQGGTQAGQGGFR